jgi:hypothetical protein
MAEQYERERQLVAELRAKITQADGNRALAAFRSVLAAVGADAETASLARLKLEAWDITGFDEEHQLTEQESLAAKAWDTAVEAARIELCDKAPFVSAEAFGLVDFLGVDRGDLPTFPMVRRVG